MTRKSHFQLTGAMILTAAVVIVLAAAASPDDSTPLRELPKAVQKTVRAHLDGARIVKIGLEEEDGRQAYEVEAEKDGKVFEYAVSPAGKFLGYQDDKEAHHESANGDDEENEEEGDKGEEHVEVIKLADAPAAVLACLSKFASPEHVEKVERITEADEDAEAGEVEDADEDEAIYEIEFATAHGAGSVTMTAGGEVLEIERAVGRGDLPAAVLEELRGEFPGADIKEANAVQVFYYEIELVIDGKTHEIKVLATGDIKDEDRGEEHAEKAEGKKGKGNRNEKDEEEDHD